MKSSNNGGRIALNQTSAFVRFYNYGNGETIFSFGDLGCESFEIVHGIVHVCIPNTNNDPNYPNKIVNTLRPGDTFGQFAQSHNGFRTATCVAKGKTRLRVVSIADSSNGLKYQSLLPVLKDTNNDRQIAEIPSFNTTTSSSVLLHRQIAEIPIQNFEELVFNNGASIIRQGDHGDSFYIIKAGLVDVVISNDSNNFIQGCCLVNQLASGQVFGTRALTSGTGIRTAHCISRAKTTVLKYLATPLILSQNVEIRQMLQSCSLPSESPTSFHIRGNQCITNYGDKKETSEPRTYCNDQHNNGGLLRPSNLDAYMQQYTFEDGDEIFLQGDKGTESFEIASGSVRITVGYNQRQVNLLHAGQHFGNFSQTNPSKERTASAFAVGRTVLKVVALVSQGVRVPSLDFKSIQSTNTCSSNDNVCQVHDYKKNETIPTGSGYFHIIVSGSVEIVQISMNGYGTKKIAMLKRGEIFGEGGAVINNEVLRTATCIALCETKLLKYISTKTLLQRNLGMSKSMSKLLDRTKQSVTLTRSLPDLKEASSTSRAVWSPSLNIPTFNPFSTTRSRHPPSNSTNSSTGSISSLSSSEATTPLCSPRSVLNVSVRDIPSDLTQRIEMLKAEMHSKNISHEDVCLLNEQKELLLLVLKYRMQGTGILSTKILSELLTRVPNKNHNNAFLASGYAMVTLDADIMNEISQKNSIENKTPIHDDGRLSTEGRLSTVRKTLFHKFGISNMMKKTTATAKSAPSTPTSFDGTSGTTCNTNTHEMFSASPRMFPKKKKSPIQEMVTSGILPSIYMKERMKKHLESQVFWFNPETLDVLVFPQEDGGKGKLVFS